MEYYGGNSTIEGSLVDPSQQRNPVSDETGLEEPMWQLRLGGTSGRELYPERPGEPECAFYSRTGYCRYGGSCRFNHPRDRIPVGNLGEYPQRVGEPACEYFLKTGTCKFGATCKYHHPKHGSPSTLLVNYLGYPFRMGEKECNYYMKTGTCKFGIACKFHHPQPSGRSLPVPPPAFYPAIQPPSYLSTYPYGGGATGWQVRQSPIITNSYVQGPYGPVLYHPGLVPFANWSSYPSPLAPLVSPTTQQTVASGSPYGSTQQLSSTASAYQGAFSTSVAGPSSSNQREVNFPERPGQPECQFFMKTGGCKFGSTCKYHHPKDRFAPACILSPMGFPMRPGAPACTFYAHHGSCKFGSTCRFDHPMGCMRYSPSASSLADMPIAPYPVGATIATLIPSPGIQSKSITGLIKDSHTEKETHRVFSSESTSSGSPDMVFEKVGLSASSGQNSTTSSGTDCSGQR